MDESVREDMVKISQENLIKSYVAYKYPNYIMENYSIPNSALENAKVILEDDNGRKLYGEITVWELIAFLNNKIISAKFFQMLIDAQNIYKGFQEGLTAKQIEEKYGVKFE